MTGVLHTTTTLGAELEALESIPFWKMNGSGNDFVVVDNRLALLPEELIAEWTRRICRPRVAIGADGVVLIEAIETAEQGDGAALDFHWRYFNADGSEGEMCGNGAMCGARFAVEHGIATSPCTFSTLSGIVRATVTRRSGATTVWLDIPDTGTVIHAGTIEAAGVALDLYSIEVGVPHAVLIVDDADRWPETGDFEAIGRAVRWHERFAPAGTNLNVISLQGGNALRMRTYERGVEAETLACGTGAVASAVVLASLGMVTPTVTIWTSSGRPLEVDFSLNQHHGTGVKLGGAAGVVATGMLLADAWTINGEGTTTQ